MAPALALLRRRRGLISRSARVLLLAAQLAAAGAAAAPLDLRVESPRLRLEQVGDDRWDVELELARLVLASAEEGAAGRILVADATVALRGRAPGELAAGHLDLELERAPDADTWSGPLQAELDQGRVTSGITRVTGPARLEAGLRLGPEGLALDGARVQAARLAVERVDGGEVEGVFDLEGGVMRVAELRTTWCGGSWQAAGTVDFGERRFEAHVDAEGADLDRLVPVVLQRDVETDLGSLDLDGRFAGDWSEPEVWLGTLTGEGQLAMRGGNLPSFSLLRAVWEALFLRIPGVEALRLDRGRAAPTKLLEIRHPFTLSGSRIATEALRIETDDYLAEGTGSLGFDGGLDLSTRVTFTTQGARKVFSMAKLPLPTLGAEDFVPIAVAVGGTLTEPSFKVDASRVSARTLVRLLGGVEGVQRAMAGVVQGGVDAVRRGVDKVLPRSKTGR